MLGVLWKCTTSFHWLLEKTIILTVKNPNQQVSCKCLSSNAELKGYVALKSRILRVEWHEEMMRLQQVKGIWKKDWRVLIWRVNTNGLEVKQFMTIDVSAQKEKSLSIKMKAEWMSSPFPILEGSVSNELKMAWSTEMAVLGGSLFETLPVALYSALVGCTMTSFGLKIFSRASLKSTPT